MEMNDVMLIVFFSLILFGLIGFLIFILVKDKNDIKREEKFDSVMEDSMLNDIDSKNLMSSENRIKSTTKSKVTSNYSTSTFDNTSEVEEFNVNADKIKKPLTKEEREKLINPFGVDMTKKIGGKTINSKNKFIK